MMATSDACGMRRSFRPDIQGPPRDLFQRSVGAAMHFDIASDHFADQENYAFSRGQRTEDGSGHAAMPWLIFWEEVCIEQHLETFLPIVPSSCIWNKR